MTLLFEFVVCYNSPHTSQRSCIVEIDGGYWSKSNAFDTHHIVDSRSGSCFEWCSTDPMVIPQSSFVLGICEP
jgi:hypothetical protein